MSNSAGKLAAILTGVLGSAALVALFVAASISPARAADRSSCPTGGSDTCTSFFMPDGAGGTCYGANANLYDGDFTTNAFRETGTTCSVNFAFASLDSYLGVDAVPVQARPLVCYGSNTTVNMPVSAVVDGVASSGFPTTIRSYATNNQIPVGCYWGSWVTYDGSSLTTSVTWTGGNGYSWNTLSVGGAGLQVRYKIPARVVPGPTETVTQPAPDPVTETATATFYAYPEEVNFSGVVEATLGAAAMAELRDVHIDDTSARRIAAPFIDAYVPAILLGVSVLVMLSVWGLVHAWGRR